MAGVTDLVKGTKEKLSNLTGNVFHVVAENNNLIRLQIDSTGRVLYDKTLARLNSETLENVRTRLAETPIGSTISEAKEKGQRSWRKAVTGNPEKKIRDYMKEVPQVKFADKLSFTFGVTCIIFTEFLALRHPEYFTQFYIGLITLLLSYRYIDYSASKSQLYMVDFCYFMNVSVILQTGLYPDCLSWYKANYVLCMGCLMAAIIMWNNSLVFHSLDKLTSFCLHAFPCLNIHLHRWGLITCQAIKLDDSLSLKDIFILPLLLYTVWQAAYLVITEVLLAHMLENDPDWVTSMRHLAVDKKNGMHILVTKVARRIGVFKRDEVFDSSTLKTKLIFVVAQVIFTLVTILPTPFLYSSYNLSCVYICIIFGLCIWRGGSYYIEVFSERYKLKFVKIDKQVKKQESISEDDHSYEDHELFNQIVDAINEANDCKPDAGEQQTCDNIHECYLDNTDQAERDPDTVEEYSSTPDSERSWEEISTTL